VGHRTPNGPPDSREEKAGFAGGPTRIQSQLTAARTPPAGPVGSEFHPTADFHQHRLSVAENPPRTAGGRPPWRQAAAVLVSALSMVIAAALLDPVLVAPAGLRGVDFHIFYVAGWALLHGLDPYRASQLGRASLTAVGVAISDPRGAFPYLPWVGWALTPWSLLPYTAALPIWIAVSGALVWGAARAWLRALRWRRAWVFALLSALSPIAFLGYQVGQLDAVLAALVVVVIVAAGRGHWFAAGLVSVVATLLKPQVALPLVPLVLLFTFRERGPLHRVLIGQAVSLALLVGVPSLLQPTALRAWSLAVLSFSRGIAQPRASLVGFPALLRLLPAGWHVNSGLTSPFTLLLVAVGTGVAVWLLRMTRGDLGARMLRPERAGWEMLLPLAVWVLISPYVHPYDTLVLLPLVILALGPGGVALRRPQGWLLISSLLVLPVAFLISSDALAATAGPLTTLAVVILVVFAVHQRRRARPLTTPRHANLA